MTINISISHRLRIGKPGDLASKIDGINSNLASTWFVLGFKRTTGAPTTLADLLDSYPWRFWDSQEGSFKATSTVRVQMLNRELSASSYFSDALAGDHIWFLIAATGSETPPPPETTFVATKPIGTLQA